MSEQVTDTDFVRVCRLDGCTLECWLHGSRFDLRTGEPSGPPAIVPIAVHTVRIEGDDVYVALTEES